MLLEYYDYSLRDLSTPPRELVHMLLFRRDGGFVGRGEMVDEIKSRPHGMHGRASKCGVDGDMDSGNGCRCLSSAIKSRRLLLSCFEARRPNDLEDGDIEFTVAVSP